MHAKMLSLSAVTLLILSACGPEKEKLDLSNGKTFEAALTTAGDWRLIQTVESAHPYANAFQRAWRVNGDPNTTEMLVAFERFELESGYDYLTVSDGSGAGLTENTGTRTGTELVVAGNSVELALTTDASVTRWGFRASVYQRQSCACQAIHKPACGVDGNTYGNACEARCAGVEVAYQSACNGSPWYQGSRLLDSPHDYTNNFDQSWTLSEGGARFIRLHFSRIDVEQGYDFVVVTDAAGNTIARYSGSTQDVTTPAIVGDTATVQLTSDSSITRFGFSIDRVDAIGGCASDADCSSGQVCNTNIQCIRAPCWSVCEQPAGGYADVTIADLETNRANWSGQRIRVVGEPHVYGAACTRRACQPSNPCCNSCSAGFVLGNAVALRDANDQPMGCRGDECNWADTCDPFEAMGSGLYEIRGTFAMDTVGQDRILIDDFTAADCQVSGCAGQACSNGGGAITSCVALPEYACYADAACEPQTSGHCGWTQTPELQTCIDDARSQRFSAGDVPVFIPDNTPNGAASRIQVGSSGPISRLLVSVDIHHTYRGDLVVTLIAPSGESFLLHNGEGGSAHDVVFADREITGATGLERGGQWTLFVVDRYARDTGTIEGWSLGFQ